MQTEKKINEEYKKVQQERQRTSFAHVALYLQGAEDFARWAIGD